YRIVEGSDGLKIVFGEGQTPAPAPLAALKAEPEPLEISAMAAPAVAGGVPIPVLPLPALPEPQLAGPPREKEGFGTKTVGPEEKKYTGDLVNLDFKDGDLQDIFRLFADI